MRPSPIPPFLGLALLVAVCGSSPSVAQEQADRKPCGANLPKADNLLMSFSGSGKTHNWYYTAAGNTFTMISNNGLPNGLIPSGPLLILIIRGSSEATKLSFSEADIEFKEGEVYTWDANGKRRFPKDVKADIAYLCDFNRSLNDKELIKIFLKDAKLGP
jgi:YD repeat-containing protein